MYLWLYAWFTRITLHQTRQPPGPGTPQDQAPPLGPGTPHPGPGTPQQTATVADGTHPTGMHSCLRDFYLNPLNHGKFTGCRYGGNGLMNGRHGTPVPPSSRAV